MFYTKDARSFLYVYKTVSEATARRLIKKSGGEVDYSDETVDTVISSIKQGNFTEYAKDQTLHWREV